MEVNSSELFNQLTSERKPSEKELNEAMAQGIPLSMTKNAAKVVGSNHSKFAWVDALPRSSELIEFAGARASLDQKIGGLLSIAV